MCPIQGPGARRAAPRSTLGASEVVVPLKSHLGKRPPITATGYARLKSRQGRVAAARTFAQIERRLISERTKQALAQKRASGVRLGASCRWVDGSAVRSTTWCRSSAPRSDSIPSTFRLQNRRSLTRRTPPPRSSWPHAWTARAAADVQQASRRLELEPGNEPLELVDGEPAVLPDVLSERCASGLHVHIRGELAVVSTVMIDNLRPLTHTPSLRAESTAVGNRSKRQRRRGPRDVFVRRSGLPLWYGGGPGRLVLDLSMDQSAADPPGARACSPRRNALAARCND